VDLDLLAATLDDLGTPAFRRRQVVHALTRELAADWDEVTTLAKPLRAQLAARVPFTTVSTDVAERSDDGSVKLRLRTHDGYPLEAVLMRFETRREGSGAKTSRYTACLSSQSGCALACTFCATGRMGLGRNLTRHEIVDQFLILAREHLRGRGARIDNVVMMGMGEPFHNYDEVIAALRTLNDPDGIGLAARRMAISTVGWIPGIDKLADEDIQIKLALSLHAPNDEVRTRLMPVTKRYNVTELMAACRRYRETTRRRIFIEYLMLQGVNDAPEHARELAGLLSGGGFHVNLIAYNPTGSEYLGSDDATVGRFAAILEGRDVPTSYRISRARDISGACGQLAAPLAAVRAQRRAERAARIAQQEPVPAG